MLYQPTTEAPNMSPRQVYQDHPGIFNAESMPNLAGTNMASQWYATTSYPFDPSYMTACPTSTVGNQAWNQLSRVSVPNSSIPPFDLQIQPPTTSQYQEFLKNSTRPRSSPSTFGPTSDNYPWASTNGLGIYSSAAIGQMTPVTSTFPPNVFQAYAADGDYIKDESFPKEEQHSIASSTPEIVQPQPRKPYPNIQPDPVGFAAQKRKRDEDDFQDLSLATKRRKRTSSVASADLSEDDRLLVKLKEEQNLPWKDIASRYSAEKGKTVQVAALQMKYKRLREKYRVWAEPDLSALRQAYEVWEKRKWEIISEKMLDFGIDERWNPKQCAKKWQELEMLTVSMGPNAGITPAMSQFSVSQFSSPIDAPAHFSWIPLS